MTDSRLDRFVAAQEASGTYDRAIAEVRHGGKRTHWMWFVFPQIAGLGRSDMAQTYAIRSLAEAESYLAHPILGLRLRECVEALVETKGLSAEDIFGLVDAAKLRSCLTLFARAAPGEVIFEEALAQYFEGRVDDATDVILREMASG